MKTLILLFSLLFSLESFSQKIKINCPPKTKLKKDISLGYLNFRGATLGQIYTVKISRSSIIKMDPLGSQSVENNNIDFGALTALKTIKVDIDFTLDASADMSEKLKAELKSELSKSMNFNLYNSKSNMIKNPTSVLQNYDPNLYDFKSGIKYALINRITIADSLIIKTDRGLDIRAGAKVKVGDFDVEIINNCSGLMQILGNQVPVYFELLVFTPQIKTTMKTVEGALGGNTRVKTKEVIWTENKAIVFSDIIQD